MRKFESLERLIFLFREPLNSPNTLKSIPFQPKIPNIVLILREQFSTSPWRLGEREKIFHLIPLPSISHFVHFDHSPTTNGRSNYFETIVELAKRDCKGSVRDVMHFFFPFFPQQYTLLNRVVCTVSTTTVNSRAIHHAEIGAFPSGPFEGIDQPFPSSKPIQFFPQFRPRQKINDEGNREEDEPEEKREKEEKDDEVASVYNTTNK